MAHPGGNGGGRPSRGASPGADVLPILACFLFFLSVYGLANAFTLKIGQFVFGKSRCSKKDCTAPGHPKETRKFLGRIPYLGDLFYCVACLSCWIGMAESAWFLSPASEICPVRWKAIVIDGLAAAGVSWILLVWTERQADGLDI